MEKARKIRMAMYPVIIIALLAFLGLGSHGNLFYWACMAIIFSAVYYTAFEQCVTLFISLRDRKKFLTYKLNKVELLGIPGLIGKPILALYLQWMLSQTTYVSPVGIYAAAAGAVIALVGVAFSIMTLRAWSTMFVGHGIQEDQKLVVTGIYAHVRNPIYLADILYWAALAVGTLNVVVGVITVVYVIPAYHLYIKAEEELMLENFGDDYFRYRQKVPSLIPSLRAYNQDKG